MPHKWFAPIPQRPNRYQALLEEHLEKWPADDTSNTARKWLGNLCRSQGQLGSGCRAYRGITPDSQFFPEAIDAAATCWEQWLRRQQQRRPTDRRQILADATGFFDAIILGPERQVAGTVERSPVGRRAGNRSLAIEVLATGLVDAQRVLQAAMEYAPADDEAWLGRSTVAADRRAGGPGGTTAGGAATATATGIGIRRPPAAVGRWTLDTRRERCAHCPQTDRSSPAGGAGPTQSNTTQLDPKHQVRFDQVRAEALRVSGQQQKALEIYGSWPPNSRIMAPCN